MTEIVKVDSATELLEAFIKVAPYLNQLIQEEISIGIYDTEKLLAYDTAKSIPMNVKIGDPLIKGEIIERAIRENREVQMIVPKDMLGISLSSRAIPIRDINGNVVGGVGVGVSLERATKLHEVAENLSAIVEQTAASFEEISRSVSTLANRVADVSDHMKEVSSGADRIGQISTVVKGVSDQSNLLGLNAAIEAARAGEVGKGFSVVADEIRKLATSSKENVTQIDDITKGIQEAIRNLNSAFSGINEFTNNQATAIEEITSIIQEISRNSQELSQMAETNLTIKK